MKYIKPEHEHRELPEWLQREADAIREQQALDRIKIALAAMTVTTCGVALIVAIYRTGGLG